MWHQSRQMRGENKAKPCNQELLLVCNTQLGLVQSLLHRLPHLLFRLGSVNLHDLCLGIVERERVELPVVVLNPLFDDFRLVALSARRRSPLSNDVIRNFELERHGSQVNFLNHLSQLSGLLLCGWKPIQGCAVGDGERRLIRDLP
jgi:hypothetical protein